MTSQAKPTDPSGEQTLPPIETLFNPNSLDYANNPGPQCIALAERGPLVWYGPWMCWIMTRMPDIMDCWKREYLSSDFYDWEFAPPRPTEENWNNFEKALVGHSLLADPDHHRLIRKITSPAFSRNVVDNINRRIEPDIAKLFAGLEGETEFDYIEQVAKHLPFISITRMVGIPDRYWPQIKQTVLTFTETWNPTISEERRAKAQEDSNRAIDILFEVIADRRANPGDEDDFLSALLKVEAENPEFDEWDIVTLILALIGAGADTTLVAQQWAAYAFLKFPDQIEPALASPEAFSNAFSEVMRWAGNSKMGFARYAPDDMELLGQQVKKGQMVLMMPHLKDHDPQFFADPDKLDVKRHFDPDVLFGYGPRYCIGAALAKHQLYLSMRELFTRFPNAELVEEPERDLEDHNSITFKSLRVRTGHTGTR
ncbi:cytochrome P450 [Spongiibacter nanhainus]|uniref:Cytochrome P450 n=1 Tax=Spongiibacter nanhainus TaxID=2794344 RepID=A0A7T4R2Q6_9GAMM|nr:cytochrome P450 [Spongiibacter nanhainus]QQD19359.1 cytochrome P450 [Spongiibacter nanhainus]